MLKKDFNDSVRNLYNINPDNLEDEYINVVKAFYLYSRLTTEAYSDQLIAKDKVKKVSAKIFLKSKMCGDTDKKAENVVSADEGVVQEANEIIGESLKENEEYLKYLWVKGLQDGSSEVIYIPTEANMPILEAGKR